LSFGIRADSVAYPGYDGEARCEGQADQSKCQWKDDHRIERVWVQLQQQDLDLRVGDLYHSMGRGLVFSVRKIDELGMDTALRGGRARGRVGSLSLQAFGGVTNIQNTDLISAGPLAERQDELVGGEIAWACGPNEPWCALPFNMTIGVRGLYADYNEDENATRDEGDWTVGGSLEMRDLVPDLLSLYFEGAFLRNLNTSQINGKNRDADGYALYGSISITPTQDLALLLEFKDYHRFQIANPELAENSLPISYHEAPTLERIDQIVLTNASATGARLLAEYYIRAIGMRVYANALWYGWSEPGTYQYDESVDNFGEKASTTLHAYLGLEKRWDGGAYLNVSGGYRLEAPNTIEADDPEFSRRLWHVESDVQIPLGGPHSLGFRTNFRQEEKVVGKVKDFIRGDVAVTYGLAPELSLGLLWTFQTENDTKYAKDTDYFGLSENGKYLNLATEVVWRFSHWGQVSLFAGRNTGGFICVSGVCRLLPPFYGVRSEFVARF
jgi:hypothetical protein